MKKMCFRIRERYLDQIEKGLKDVEYRRDIDFWHVRIGNIMHTPMIWQILDDPEYLFLFDHLEDIMGIFMCGKRIHRRQVVAISRIKTPDYFSDQGKADVNTPTCLAFYLGQALTAEGKPL